MDHLADILKKFIVAALLGVCGYLYHFITNTDFKLAVLEWRVNQQFGPPSWEK